MPNSIWFWCQMAWARWRLLPELGQLHVGATCGHLVTKVLHIKDTYRRYVGVDALATTSWAAFAGAYHHITNISNPDGSLEVVDVTGSLCENNDKFAKHRELPQVRCDVSSSMMVSSRLLHGLITMAALRSAEILLERGWQLSFDSPGGNHGGLFCNHLWLLILWIWRWF